MHGLEIRLGRNTRAWFARLRSMPHVRSSLGAGHSGRRPAFVRTVVSKVYHAGVQRRAFQTRQHHQRLLHRIMFSHPPAMLWSDVSAYCVAGC